MVHLGEADGLVSGLTKHYPDTLRPALQIIKLRDGVSKVAGLYAMVFKEGVYFIADATVNIVPSAEDLAEIAMLAAKEVQRFNIEPRVALLSFSNFGSVKHPLSEKVQQALAILRPGQFYGEMGLLTGAPRSAHVYGHELGKLLEFPNEELRRLLEKEPRLGTQFLWAFSKALCERLQETNTRLATFLTLSKFG